MDSFLLLPSNLDLELLDYELYPDRIDLQVISTASSTCCPLCRQISHKIHSCYGRIIHDLPSGGRRVRLQLQVRKYFCKNADCPRLIFTERFVTGLASYSIRKIATTLKMSRRTVAKYWNRIEFVPKASRKRSNILDFEAYLQQRWQEGQQSAKALYEEISDKGFTYSQATVYNMVRKYPKSVLEPLLASVKATYYSSKQLSIWLGMYQSDWEDYMPIEFLKKLLEENPLIKAVREISLEFRQLMKAKQGDQLQDWCNKALDSGVEALKGFVRGIKQDFKAIFQAFTSEWSNGQVEGQVNRLKNIKRQMYGRASFELLRKRVILMGISDFHQM